MLRPKGGADMRRLRASAESPVVDELPALVIGIWRFSSQTSSDLRSRLSAVLAVSRCIWCSCALDVPCRAVNHLIRSDLQPCLLRGDLHADLPECSSTMCNEQQH